MKTGTTIALGIGGVLALLFFAEKAKAKGTTGGAGATPVEGGKPLASPAQARVVSAAPLRLHSTPTASPSTVTGRASPGTIVQVVQTGIPSKDAASREWWEIITPSARGFASAVGAKGEQNLVLI